MKDFYALLQPCGSNSGLPRVVCILSSLLERVVARNDEQEEVQGSNPRGHNHRLSVFHGLHSPSITIEKYLERIFKYANCSTSCFVVAYAYMDRFIQQHPALPITSLNAHRLLITSVMVAAKFMDDTYYNNAYYAKIGGVSTREMNWLEMGFLFGLGFRLQITVSAFERYCSHLQREMLLCGGFHVERPLLLQFGCASLQDNTSHKQQQGMSVCWSYAAVL